MFRGVSQLNLDSKGRLVFPARFRDRLINHCDGEVVATIDYRDKCLVIYPLPEWEVIEQKLIALPDMRESTKRFKRLLIGHAQEIQVDNNGRALVPPPLRDFAGLAKKVVLIGQGNKLELWDEARWEQRRTQWLEEAAAPDAELPEDLEGLSL
ncbi:division/cell wall cluster transcriptional repressor MraZ [Halorhodospira halochloris]|uniref:Transcriptional regulator MraZ n=1 Tax=Halorhodospira halochloris TaxID=1052 RepID=A0A0X8XAK7_HALHR|nr:division/cell wall cluster transcriptional repressor MraZ [Halorhodospira halochloris]MBK1651657.1 cell division/cell wall cluster transcriptional repressor MraZ [Halorhodospira halochloris]MCG5529579.1 division/cell wall cluster transcriptional repressor MraZ [Halorhodospira halochloris]MCG5548142.1 division/cell wall cluster transcriptional repressor MraZ [Halorhodospira halochloris]BAU58521.1 cell division protein MraZ [Halorhodospira halochloris]